MQHVPFPPTRTDVVKVTIVQSKKVSEKCGSTFAVITYDLSITKIANKIQNEELDEFKDVFIMLGGFHVEGSIFSAIGKLIEGSGGSYLLSLVSLSQVLWIDFSTEKCITVVGETK